MRAATCAATRMVPRMTTPSKPLSWKSSALVAALFGVAILGPLTAYAAVTVIYPKSTHTLGVAGTPPIAFYKGSDYSAASNSSFAANWAGHDGNSSFSIDLNALSGGNVTIGQYVQAVRGAGVSKYRMEIADAFASGGGLTGAEVASLKIRLWTGGVEPTTDTDAGVCGVLDLKNGAAGNRTAYCSGPTVYLQSVFELNADATGAATVSIRPADVVFV